MLDFILQAKAAADAIFEDYLAGKLSENLAGKLSENCCRFRICA
jgi:hypothetical protein